MATDNLLKPISRDELFELYKFYDASTKDELSFFFQYFHFYIGLLSAILAVTLTGLLNVSSQDLRGLILLIGPILILILSRVGYDNVQAFYRRFTEAWVAKINVESMLNIQEDTLVEQGVQKPIYANHKGGFIPEIEWQPLKIIFDEAKKNAWPAEQVAHKLVGVGTTLSNARWTFNVFNGASLVLVIVTILIAVL
jgi:hypothetical protein